jgi:hypothetical protein
MSGQEGEDVRPAGSEGHPDERPGKGCSLVALPVIAVGGLVLIFTPQQQWRWLTWRLVAPVWVVAACLSLQLVPGKGNRPHTYGLKLWAGPRTTLLGVLAFVMLILILCTGFVSGPITFRE